MCSNPIQLLITRKETGEKEWIQAPCGQCPTCLKRRAKDWTIKLINEAKYHKEACFITLTFDNAILLDNNSKAVKEYGAKANFPYNINYSKKYFCKFIKRLRKKFKDKKITYYHIGEYGEKTHRAHHHVIIFGIDFREDAIQADLSKSGKPQLFSQTLEDIWACGRTRIQLINDNNIAYIAGYNSKKIPINRQEKPPNKYEEYTKWWNEWKRRKNQYKPIQSFSNRSKMSVKWIRKHPEQLRDREFLTDKNGKKYAFPKSYIREMKLECEKGAYTSNPLYIQAYQSYDQRREDFSFENNKLSKKEQITKAKIKEEIDFIRNSKKLRDF